MHDALEIITKPGYLEPTCKEISDGSRQGCDIMEVWRYFKFVMLIVFGLFGVVCDLTANWVQVS